MLRHKVAAFLGPALAVAVFLTDDIVTVIGIFFVALGQLGYMIAADHFPKGGR